jgi:ribosomal protein S27AE
MENLIDRLKRDHPSLDFRAGQSHCWSPLHGQIFYPEDGHANIEGILHELGHARLGHETYHSDLDLLNKEVEAWGEARLLAKSYKLSLDLGHIEDCLDTYRDWVYKRSICPNCQATGLQESSDRYLCLNCGGTWHVTPSRFKRPYRRSNRQK